MAEKAHKNARDEWRYARGSKFRKKCILEALKSKKFPKKSGRDSKNIIKFLHYFSIFRAALCGCVKVPMELDNLIQLSSVRN